MTAHKQYNMKDAVVVHLTIQRTTMFTVDEKEFNYNSVYNSFFSFFIRNIRETIRSILIKHLEVFSVNSQHNCCMQHDQLELLHLSYSATPEQASTRCECKLSLLRREKDVIVQKKNVYIPREKS